MLHWSIEVAILKFFLTASRTMRASAPNFLTNKGPQDRSRISLLEPHEVQYWADKFNVSKERLSEAVRNVGHSVTAVEKELKRLA
jgi:hypothetical protein